MNARLPPLDSSSSPDCAVVVDVARRVAAEGGRAVLVGGWVRDALLAALGRGRPSKDLDVEVFGVSLDTLRRILAVAGPVDEVGASFAVLRIKRVDVDFSLPRRDTKDGAGHRGFLVEADPSMSFADAARRRDFTINSISMDPLTGEVVDPCLGRVDLEAGLLRVTDPATFGEDPLRALRAVQMAARFDLVPTDDLPPILGAQDIAELPSERIEGELSKFLLRGVRPSRGIDLLRHLDRDGLPGLAAPPRTWDRRCAALDRYVAMRPADRGAALAEGWTLLTLGASPTDREALLRRVRPPQAVQAATVALAMTAPPPPDPARLRALAWSLRRAGVSLASVFRVAEAQGFAVPGRAVAASVGVLDGPLPSVVQGRDLLARGMTPGPEVGGLIARCRQVQDEFGLDDVDQILARVAPTLAN